MKTCYIMRGVSGSGKTLKAKELAGVNGVIHSTSDYFIINGEYRYDERKVRDFHIDNLDAFKESLAFDLPIVICDNTNIRKWEFKPYLEAAKSYGYEVKIVEMPHPSPEIASKQGVHRVPQHVIKKMISGWEDYK